jgi:putative membrane protein
MRNMAALCQAIFSKPERVIRAPIEPVRCYACATFLTRAADMPNYLTGILLFFQYFSLSMLMLTVFWSVYTFMTPHDEMELIKAGNVTASVALIGALLGFALPIAAAILNAVSPLALMQWGVIAMLVQLLVYAVLRIFFRTLSEDLIADRLSVGLLVGSLSAIAGLLNAAAMSY